MKGIPLDEIAQLHKRRRNGVKSRIIRNGMTMMKQKDLSIEELSRLIHIPLVDIMEYCQKDPSISDKKLSITDKKLELQEKRLNLTEQRLLLRKEKQEQRRECRNGPLHDLLLSSQESYAELNHLRNEVKQLRSDVSELLRLMNALYDFESSQ